MGRRRGEPSSEVPAERHRGCLGSAGTRSVSESHEWRKYHGAEAGYGSECRTSGQGWLAHTDERVIEGVAHQVSAQRDRLESILRRGSDSRGLHARRDRSATERVHSRGIGADTAADSWRSVRAEAPARPLRMAFIKRDSVIEEPP